MGSSMGGGDREPSALTKLKMEWQEIMDFYSSTPQKWNVYRDGTRIVNMDFKSKNKSRYKTNKSYVMEMKSPGIFCPCCHNTFPTTDAYLRHKAIQDFSFSIKSVH